MTNCAHQVESVVQISAGSFNALYSISLIGSTGTACTALLWGISAGAVPIATREGSTLLVLHQL